VITKDGSDERFGSAGTPALLKIWNERIAPLGFTWLGERTSSADIQLLGLYPEGSRPTEDAEGNPTNEPLVWLKYSSGRTAFSVRPLEGGRWHEITMKII
jgi:hypothetical protein